MGLEEVKITEKTIDLISIDTSSSRVAEKKISMHGLRLCALDLLKTMTSSEFGIQLTSNSFDIVK